MYFGRCLLQVWDLLDHTCLMTVRPKAHQIRGELQMAYYSKGARAIVVATDQMSLLQLRVKCARLTITLLISSVSLLCRY